MLIKRVIGWPYAYGGEEHSGWLPPGAARPLATPIVHVFVDLEIEGDDNAGYLLIYSAQDGSFSNDDWYQSLEQAEEAAKQRFGIAAEKWKPV